MSYVFSALKAAQSAAIILKHKPSCEMSYMKLLKLLYIADRESIKETGTPITGDYVVAMKYGPVLSGIYDFMMKRSTDGFDVWGQFIDTIGMDLKLVDDPGTSLLCKYEIDKLNEVYERYKSFDQFALAALTHSFPEWVQNNPGTSSRDIPLQHIIDAVGRSDSMDDILQAQADDFYFAKLFGETPVNCECG